MSIIFSFVVLVVMPLLQIDACPKQINSFDVNQQIHQVNFSDKKDPANIARHSIYKNWMGLKKIHEDTQLYILMCFIGSFITVAVGLCCMKLGKKAFRTFYGVRNELQELRLRTANQNT